MRMKPIHLAAGYFLALTGAFFRLEWLNKAAIISHKDGLKGEYTTTTLLEILRAEDRIGTTIDRTKLDHLRAQLNATLGNDGAMWAAFAPYSAFGNDYTFTSARLLTNQKRLDGFAGLFLMRVFERTESGQAVLEFSRTWIEQAGDLMERFVQPLLDPSESTEGWTHRFEEKFGEFDEDRLDAIAARMQSQTAACARLCRNLNGLAPHPSRLRFLTIGLSLWLLSYLIHEASAASNAIGGHLLFADFIGDTKSRCRAQSCASFARHRELIYRSYPAWNQAGRFQEIEANYSEFKDDFKILEEHFSDLAVRCGLAQPRAAQAKRKHYELQPDTCRALVMSLIEDSHVVELPILAQRLKETWGICVGAAIDDRADLHAAGYHGLDDDDDLRVNRGAFIALLKKLELAFEPSDGLVLCALQNDPAI